jgi:membrane protein YqaA with SNARE-associated domain
MQNAGQRFGTSYRRAYIFSGILVLLGLLNLLLMLYQPDLHPQLVLFLFSIPSNSAVSLLPHEPVLIRYGQLHPLLATALSATLGTLVAGVLDWHIFVPLLNWQKLSAYRDNRFYRFCMDHFKSAPFAWLLLAGFTPLPFAAFKFLAFSMNYPLGNYLAALCLSRFPRYLLLAWLGHTFNIPPWSLIVLFLAIAAFTAHQAARNIPKRATRQRKKQ